MAEYTLKIKSILLDIATSKSAHSKHFALGVNTTVACSQKPWHIAHVHRSPKRLGDFGSFTKVNSQHFKKAHQRNAARWSSRESSLQISCFCLGQGESPTLNRSSSPNRQASRFEISGALPRCSPRLCKQHRQSHPAPRAVGRFIH